MKPVKSYSFVISKAVLFGIKLVIQSNHNFNAFTMEFMTKL